MARGNVQHHVNNVCDYVFRVCKRGACTHLKLRKDMERHCRKKTTQVWCPYCITPFMGRHALHSQHRDDRLEERCPGAPDCKKRFLTHEELVEHEKDCKWVKRACKASIIGCKYSGIQRALDAHQTACSLIKVMPQWQAMQELCKQQDESLAAVQAQKSQLEQEIQRLLVAYEGDKEHANKYVDKLHKRIAKLERERKRKRTTVTRPNEDVTSADRRIVIHTDDGGEDEQDDDNGARQTRRSKRVKKNTTERSDRNADTGTGTAQSGSTTTTVPPQSTSRNQRAVSESLSFEHYT